MEDRCSPSLPPNRCEEYFHHLQPCIRNSRSNSVSLFWLKCVVSYCFRLPRYEIEYQHTFWRLNYKKENLHNSMENLRISEDFHF